MEGQTRAPVYRQIAESFRTRILCGELPLGSRLPTVRELARDQGVARQTAMLAYGLLKEWRLIETKVGNGTRVAGELPREEARALVGLIGRGPMMDFEKLSDAGGLRSLATAVPDPAFFRADEYLAEFQKLRSGSPWAFYYAPPAGVPDLRTAIAKRAETEERQVLVTLGATHAISLIVDEFCKPGDRVAIEEPGFLDWTSFFASRSIEVVRLPTTTTGIEPSAFDSANVKMAIVTPSFGSATGNLMPDLVRARLVRMAEAKGIVLVEDAHYRPLGFARQPPPLISYSSGQQVFHVDALSGYLAPGLRTGWIVARPDWIARLERRVRLSGTAGMAPVQVATAAYLERGLLDAHLARVLPRYQERRDALVSALRFDWPDEATFTMPQGGLSTWITLPPDRDWGGLYEEALRHGVPFAPGRLFGHGAHELRLSYGVQRPEAIREAAAILGQIVARRLSIAT